MDLPTKWVKLKRFCEYTGQTRDAIEHKIRSGKYLYGQHYILDPDNRKHINVHAYDAWVEGRDEQINRTT